LPYSGLHCISSRMAFLSPVTAGQPVGEARFVRAILLPVRTPSLRRVFRDFYHAECVEYIDCREQSWAYPSVIHNVPLPVKESRPPANNGSFDPPKYISQNGTSMQSKNYTCEPEPIAVLRVVQRTCLTTSMRPSLRLFSRPRRGFLCLADEMVRALR